MRTTGNFGLELIKVPVLLFDTLEYLQDMHSFNCESVAQKKNVLLTITVMPESRQTRSNQLFPGGEQHPILTIEPPSPMPEDNSHRSGAKKNLTHI